MGKFNRLRAQPAFEVKSLWGGELCNCLWIFLICLTSSLGALPLGNPAEPHLLQEPDAMSLRLGYYNDTAGTTPMVAPDWIQEARWMTNAGQLTLNLFGRLDAFAAAGMSTFRTAPRTLEKRMPQDGNANACLSIRTLPSFSYSYGLRATLIQMTRFSLGVEGETLHANPRPFFATAKGQEKPQQEEERMTLTQRQLGLAASYTIPLTTLIVPYAGVKWRQVHLDMEGLTLPTSIGSGGALRNLEQQMPWSTTLGCALVGKQRWSLSLEADIWQQRAGSLIAQFRY